VYTNRQTKLCRSLNVVAFACLSAFLLGVATGCGGPETTALPGSAPEAAREQDQGTNAPSPRASAESKEALTGSAGTCSTGIENGGHTAVARCSGYQNTGLFRVVATCCLAHCSGPVSGPWAALASGTSKVSCGSAYATKVHIESGPPMG